jgi:hypothetical protein
VMSIGYGLMIWAILGLTLGVLHGYWGRHSHYLGLEHFRMLVYLCILVYWIVALWRNEPEREQLSPEIHDAILHVTDKVSYDLAKVLGTREKESRYRRFPPPGNHRDSGAVLSAPPRPAEHHLEYSARPH